MPHNDHKLAEMEGLDITQSEMFIQYVLMMHVFPIRFALLSFLISSTRKIVQYPDNIGEKTSYDV